MKFKLFFFITTVTMLASCTSKTSSNDTDCEAKADTVTITEVKEVQASHLNLLETPDLTYFQVKGNVRSIKTKGVEDMVTFDKEGQLKASGEFSRLKRDPKGYISSWGYDEYFVTWENSKPKTYKIRESDGGESITTYYYNEKGQLSKAEQHSEYPGEDVWNEIRNYSYNPKSFDSHGNWVKRTVTSNQHPNSYIEERTITYYE